MTQQLTPLEYGHYYHIYNRGNDKGDIFFERRNYPYFLKLYKKYIVPIADTYAYCLMKNHFHLLVRLKTVEEQWLALRPADDDKVLDPTQQFSNMFNSYAKSINKAYDRSGSLFQKHFGRVLVNSDRYFIYLITYIHRNPQKHGFVTDYRTYPYSSYRAIRSQSPSQLENETALAWFGDVAAFDHCHQTWTNEAKIRHLIEDDFW